jgi:3-hydroxyacyl-[acyl-carrier-protein] dehydratase
MIMFDIDEIIRNVPHRYPFLLIDRVLDFIPNQKTTTLKNVTINEAQFQGHFPQKPVFPGVYIIENMAQSACFLLIKSCAGGVDPNTVYYLGRVNRVTFKKPVRPGDQLITGITVIKLLGTSALVEAVSRVDGEMVAKGELMFGIGKA